MQQLYGEDAQLNQQAMMLKRVGDFEKAISIYKDLISRNPICNDLYYNLAKVYTVMTSTNDALVYYMNSIHLDLIDCNNYDSGLPDQYWDIINAFNIEKDIFVKRCLNDPPSPLEKLSKFYKVSRERIRQIEVRSFEKVKKLILETAIAEGKESLYDIKKISLTS